MNENELNNKIYQFNVLKTPRFVCIGKKVQNKIVFPSHKHYDVAEFVYIKNGTGYVKINNKTFTIEDNSILIFNPYVTHEEYYVSTNSIDIELYYFEITDYVVNNNKNSNIIPPDIPINIATDNETFNYFKNNLDKILDEITQNKLGSAHLVSAICMQLYIETLRLFDKKYNCFSSLYDEKDIIVDNIKKYIDDNFSTPTLSIVDLEKIFHISHYYLSRLFKKKTGITIKEYLILTRMNFAKEKLLNSQCVISEIAKDSGYNDIYHFFKEFKKRYGVSPKTYRKINSKKE